MKLQIFLIILHFLNDSISGHPTFGRFGRTRNLFEAYLTNRQNHYQRKADHYNEKLTNLRELSQINARTVFVPNSRPNEIMPTVISNSVNINLPSTFPMVNFKKKADPIILPDPVPVPVPDPNPVIIETELESPCENHNVYLNGIEHISMASSNQGMFFTR
uniref:CSON010606 protein n=1 Tax=Culicoides sonorensis TaxID=179676 RepID=A0A336LFN4_CULSO